MVGTGSATLRNMSNRNAQLSYDKLLCQTTHGGKINTFSTSSSSSSSSSLLLLLLLSTSATASFDFYFMSTFTVFYIFQINVLIELLV